MKHPERLKKKNLLGFFIDFYKRFPIPWWLFIINTVLGVVYTEAQLKLAQILIRVTKGELYNSVIITYALMYVGNALLAYIQNRAYDVGANKVILRARLMLWKKILHLPVEEIEEQQPSSLISAATNDVGSSAQSIGYLFLMISSLYSFVRVSYTLYSYNAELSMYMLVLIPFAVVVFWAVGKTQAYGFRLNREALNEMTMFFSEHVSAAKYVKAASMEEKEISSGNAAIERRFRSAVIYAFLYSFQTMFFRLYYGTTVALVAVFGSRQIRNGKMEQTGLTDFNTYMNNVTQVISELLIHYQTFKGCQATLGRVSEILHMPTEDPNQGVEWADGEDKDIVFDHVSFGYTQDREILHDVSLRIPAGKMTAIIGDNGCGKSTVLKLAQGFYQPASGSIYVGGNQVSQVKPAQLRARFGYVLQNSEMFATSLRDNMTYGVQEEVSDEQVADIGRKACLQELAQSLPEGYDTVLSEAGSQLSGGQRQRVAIARAMIQKPDYLLLDEAGSALDYKTYSQIHTAIKEQMQGRTTVFIAHDMREILTADHVIVMNKGRVEAAGSHQELISVSPTYADYISKMPKEVAV